jgi:hypothetical protein
VKEKKTAAENKPTDKCDTVPSPTENKSFVCKLEVPNPPTLVRSACGITQFNTYSAVWPVEKDPSRHRLVVELREPPASPLQRTSDATEREMENGVSNALTMSPFDAIKSLQCLGLNSPLSAINKKRLAVPEGQESPPILPALLRSPGHGVSASVAAGPSLPFLRKNSNATVKPQGKDDSQSRRFKRWTFAEDEILADAVEREGGPPHNWKLISNTYFHDSRSTLQVRRTNFLSVHTRGILTQIVLRHLFRTIVQVPLEKRAGSRH